MSSGPPSLTPANADVLAFYRDLPFNYWGSASDHAKHIRATNQLANYPALDRLLRRGTRVLDVGCGAGWCSLTAAYHHHCEVTGIDFNEVAIERARETAKILNVAVKFEVADLFRFVSDSRFDVVISLGVLHHTNDCLGALRCLCTRDVKPGGHIFIGLYHRHGRQPFLEHFRGMKNAGASEAEMMADYRRLHSSVADETHLVSWFRDQVLHPHETQHTLAEIMPVLEDAGMQLVSTSINGFSVFRDRQELFEAEIGLKAVAQERLRQGRYFPGFFVFLARKKEIPE